MQMQAKRASDSKWGSRGAAQSEAQGRGTGKNCKMPVEFVIYLAKNASTVANVDNVEQCEK